MSEIPKVLICRLIKTTRRLTFDIVYQDPKTIWMGDDDGEYHRFVASNGYEVISRSRMDIQTERHAFVTAKVDAAVYAVKALVQQQVAHGLGLVPGLPGIGGAWLGTAIALAALLMFGNATLQHDCL